MRPCRGKADDDDEGACREDRCASLVILQNIHLSAKERGKAECAARAALAREPRSEIAKEVQGPQVPHLSAEDVSAIGRNVPRCLGSTRVSSADHGSH